MHEISPVASFLNEHVFNLIARLLGIQVAAGHQAVPDQIVMILIVALGLTFFAWWLRGKLSVDNPTGIQHLIEVAFQAIQNLMREVIGTESVRFTPIIGTLAIYILLGNLLGFFPGFMSPTSNLNVTAACALCVFLYYNFHGFRKHGFLGYMKHFAGPVIYIAPFLFLIEVVSHLARPVSLSIRLFGNILAEELIIGSLNNLFPFFISAIVMFLSLLLSTIQAFIFILLTMVYLSGAVEESHQEDHGAAHSDRAAHESDIPIAAA
jgi:F-type H+-transporting ATPase subunit a